MLFIISLVIREASLSSYLGLEFLLLLQVGSFRSCAVVCNDVYFANTGEVSDCLWPWNQIRTTSRFNYTKQNNEKRIGKQFCIVTIQP